MKEYQVTISRTYTTNITLKFPDDGRNHMDIIDEKISSGDENIWAYIAEKELEQKIGKILTDNDYNILITKDTTVRFPNGQVGAIYLKEAIPENLSNDSYEVLHSLKSHQTGNLIYRRKSSCKLISVPFVLEHNSL